MTMILPEKAAQPAAREVNATIAEVQVERAERLALLAERRKAERSSRLIHLQQERPDLVSAYAPADFAADALRWTI